MPCPSLYEHGIMSTEMCDKVSSLPRHIREPSDKTAIHSLSCSSTSVVAAVTFLVAALDGCLLVGTTIGFSRGAFLGDMLFEDAVLVADASTGTGVEIPSTFSSAPWLTTA